MDLEQSWLSEFRFPLLSSSFLSFTTSAKIMLIKVSNKHMFFLLGSFEPHLLVLLGFALAMAEYFPENLIKAVFNIEFLAKLDAQLDSKC